MGGRDQRELRRAVRDAERLTFVERMPFSSAIATDLFEALNAALGKQACRQNFELTARWCESRSVNVPTVIAWLRSEGGGCDCEAFNVEERFTDAMKAF